MIYIAKMHTRYPEFHGTGYYNFLMESSKEALDAKIEEYSHDFSLEATRATKFTSVQNLQKKYSTKQELNAAYFGGK